MASGLGDIGALLSGIGTVVVALVTVITAYSAIREYKRSGQRDRTRLLAELFDRFYARGEYREVYLAFDDGDRALLDRLEAVVTQDPKAPTTDAEAEWKLTAYLNFFEFVASLRRLEQIEEHDFNRLFFYPFTQLQKAHGMPAYLHRNQYTELAARCASAFAKPKP